MEKKIDDNSINMSKGKHNGGDMRKKLKNNLSQKNSVISTGEIINEIREIYEKITTEQLSALKISLDSTDDGSIRSSNEIKNHEQGLYDLNVCSKRYYEKPISWKYDEIVLTINDLPSHMIPPKKKTDKDKFIEVTLGMFLVIASAFVLNY